MDFPEKVEFNEDGTVKQWWKDGEENNLEVRWFNEQAIDRKEEEELKSLRGDAKEELCIIEKPLK